MFTQILAWFILMVFGGGLLYALVSTVVEDWGNLFDVIVSFTIVVSVLTLLAFAILVLF